MTVLETAVLLPLECFTVVFDKNDMPASLAETDILMQDEMIHNYKQKSDTLLHIKI